MFKIKNIIILAAGRGSRMKDLTDNTAKPLLRVNDKPLIENIIEYFINKGINDISIVIGYKKEQFEYLKSKYSGVTLYENNDWDKPSSNNITSLKCVLHKLSNTLIINGDVLILKDQISLEYNTSCTYAEYNTCINEWFIELDRKNNILEFNRNPINATGLFQREITVLNIELSELVKKEVESYGINEYYELLVLYTARKYNIPFKAFVIDKNVVFDIDNKEEFLNYSSKEKNEW